MSSKRIIVLFVISYLLGVGITAVFHQINKPTEEQVRIRNINSAIQLDLCARLAVDLEDFQKAPNSFKRTSLETIYSEALVTVKATSLDVKKDEAIEFMGNPENLVSECLDDAQRWVKVPTYFPEYFENEHLLVFGYEHGQDPNQELTDAEKQITNAKRLALVIGNSNYQDRPLKNPINDAQDIGKALKSSGFEVVESYDADSKSLRKAINDFSKIVGNYDTVLLYYSGHGIEFLGRNFFIPIDADIKAEEEIPRQGFDITTVVEQINRTGIKTSIFILDACRNTPVFSKFRSAKSGLASMQTSGGSVIAYSAAPGKLAFDGDGRNSPYTTALLEQMQMPGKKIEDVLKDTAQQVSKVTAGRQMPWYNSSLVGDFYFVKK